LQVAKPHRPGDNANRCLVPERVTMNGVVINLMLAAFWLVLGAGLLLHEGITGERRFRLPLGGINPGWLAIIFAAFNFYRVLMIRSYQRRLREKDDDKDVLRSNFERRREERRREELQHDQPPNPDFMFTDDPAKRAAAPPPAPADEPAQKPNPEIH
jgi:hypothetical protein